MALPAAGQEAQHATGSVGIRRVTDSVIEIQIHNEKTYPVNIAVSDKAQRLNALGYQWEALTETGWSVLTPKPPEGAVFGDLPPQFLEVGAGANRDASYRFLCSILGCKERDEATHCREDLA